jgi:predicted membrane channel-forming protein YqfA (hemolysin III family)
MVQIKSTAQTPFEEADASAKEKKKFLGFNKRYLRSIPGAVHGLASVLSLILANCLFLLHTLFGLDQGGSSNQLGVAFYVCNVVSAGVTSLFFWNKIQVRGSERLLVVTAIHSSAESSLVLTRSICLVLQS